MRCFRKWFLWAWALLPLLAAGGLAHAGIRCHPAEASGMERCVSGLPPSLILRMQQNQDASNWCWAASVAMILRRYGVFVPQQQIAREYLGTPENVKIQAQGMAELLNRTWQDSAGAQLESAAAPLPAWRRHFGLAAPEVLEELDEGRPLLLAVQQHAMVLVQLVYERPMAGQGGAEDGLRIVRAVVLDPQAPLVLRSLRPAERQPDYLARVAVRNGAFTAQAAHDIPPNAGDQPQLASR